MTSNKNAWPTHFFVEQNGTKAILRTNVTFDRENPLRGAVKVDNQVKYMVTVELRDKGFPKSLSTVCFFFVIIEDVNDNNPIFDESNYMTTIRDDTDINSRVLRVFAIDDDEGANGEVVYTIETEDAKCINCFRIDSTSGWISVSSDISKQVCEQQLYGSYKIEPVAYH